MEERIITEENTQQQCDEAQAEIKLVEEIPMPMAWHKFQKNFLLWLIMLLYLVRVFFIFSGRIYLAASIRETVYAGMPLLRILDYAFCAHCAACGALLVVSAVRLNQKSASMLARTNMIMALGEIAYVLIRWAVTELPPMNLQCASLMIAHALLWRINRAYYKKRAYLPGKEKT